MKTLEQQAIDIVIRYANGEDKGLWEEAKLLAPKLMRKPEKPTVEEIDQFNQFRLKYQKLGTVNGCMAEMDIFTKHKDWRDVLPLLHGCIARQIKERQAKADAGEFVPPWPKFSTYIGKSRRWETVYYDLGNQVKHNLDERYAAWLRNFESKYCPYSEIIEKAFTREQFEDWKNKKGIFAGIDRSMSEEAAKTFFGQLHIEYFKLPGNKTKWPTVADYYQHRKNSL